MNKYILLPIVSVLWVSSLFSQEQTQLTDQFLKDNVIQVMSIDPAEKDHEDLRFLAKELNGVEIVLLGEQGHGDGSTFLAKTRLIKYLHEEQGYNVIAFESGLFDCYRVWEAIQNGADSLEVFRIGVFSIWTASQQVKPLFQYILDQSKTDNPLILTGFDMQMTGGILPPERFKLLDDYLKQRIEIDWVNQYPNVAKVYENTREIFINPLTDDQVEQLGIEVNRLSDRVAAVDNSFKGQVFSRYILNYWGTITLYSKADMQNPSNTPHVFNLRDNQMAKNFELIKEVLFPGEKIIAWGANTHFGYGRGLLGSFEGKEAPQQGMVPAGQYLKINYQEKLYSLAFTSFQGQGGSLNNGPYDIAPAKPETLEYQLNKMGVVNGFLSFRNPELKSKRFVTNIYGRIEMSGKWAHMADGVFFIRDMKASKFK
ncbi:MAG: erythromycin esterase [Roseivirga sp.]|jgi:erythromycin esterase